MKQVSVTRTHDVTNSTTVTTIDLLRHGECKGGEIFRGSTDVELTDTGWQTLQKVVEHQFHQGLWEYVISSPLLRCRQFAEKLNGEHNIPLIIEDDFREIDFGDWEGMEYQTVWNKDKDKVESIYSDPDNFQAPNGEPMSAFSQRVISAWELMFKKYRGKHLLLVQHGGTIRVMLTHLLSTATSSMTRFNIPYGCYSRVEIYHTEKIDQFSLVFHNLHFQS